MERLSSEVKEKARKASAEIYSKLLNSPKHELLKQNKRVRAKTNHDNIIGTPGHDFLKEKTKKRTLELRTRIVKYPAKVERKINFSNQNCIDSFKTLIKKRALLCLCYL